MPRPSKLNDAVQERMLQAIAGGAGQEMAARHAGITPSTHFLWMAKGRAASAKLAAGGRPNAEELRFSEYSEAVETARRTWELAQLAEIQQAGIGAPYRTSRTTTRQELNKDGDVVTLTTTVVETGSKRDWRALAQLLKWRRPSEYGDRLELADPISPEEQAQMIAEAAERTLAELGVKVSDPKVRRTLAKHLTLVVDEAEERAS